MFFFFFVACLIKSNRYFTSIGRGFASSVQLLISLSTPDSVTNYLPLQFYSKATRSYEAADF